MDTYLAVTPLATNIAGRGIVRRRVRTGREKRRIVSVTLGITLISGDRSYSLSLRMPYAHESLIPLAGGFKGCLAFSRLQPRIQHFTEPSAHNGPLRRDNRITHR